MDDENNENDELATQTETEQNAEAEAAVQKLLAEMQAKHNCPLLGYYVEGHGPFIFKRGGHADWKRSKAQRLQVLTKPEVVVMANTNLARSLLVHPDAETWRTFALAEPGAADDLGGQIFERLDGSARVILGKATG